MQVKEYQYDDSVTRFKSAIPACEHFFGEARSKMIESAVNTYFHLSGTGFPLC